MPSAFQGDKTVMGWFNNRRPEPAQTPVAKPPTFTTTHYNPTPGVQQATTESAKGQRIAPGVVTGGRASKLSKKFDRCVKAVRRTVRARKGSNKESAAIAICTKTVLQPRGKTLKRYKKGRLVTQKKMRGGAELTPAALRELRGTVRTATYEELKEIVDKIDLLGKDADVRAAFNAYGNALRNNNGVVTQQIRNGMILGLAMAEMAAVRAEQERADQRAAQAAQAAPGVNRG